MGQMSRAAKPYQFLFKTHSETNITADDRLIEWP